MKLLPEKWYEFKLSIQVTKEVEFDYNPSGMLDVLWQMMGSPTEMDVHLDDPSVREIAHFDSDPDVRT